MQACAPRVSALTWAVSFSPKATAMFLSKSCMRRPMAAGFRVSLATVYNALHRFTEAGLLLELVLDNGRTYFDTNLSDHHHFFVEGEGRLIDVVADIGVDRLPKPPEGMEITSVELIVRVRRRPDPSLPSHSSF